MESGRQTLELQEGNTMIRVVRLNGDGVKAEDFDAKAWAEQNGMLILHRDVQGRQPFIAFASGVWLSVEVL